MGCVFAKHATVHDTGSPDYVAVYNRSSRSKSTRSINSAENTNGLVENKKPRRRHNGVGGSGTLVSDTKRKREQSQVRPNPWLSNPPKHLEGEQIAAGWPAWLASEAGEALKGWIPRRADSFEKLDKIGQGTYSNVYKARDLDVGNVVALKKVRFDNMEPESVRFMAREIQILRCLNHPNIVKLEGLVTSRMSCSLYLVFEYMEHDLAGLTACADINFTESQVKCYLQQILRGLDHCHSRGVLHRDIKGSNLLLDNSGILKIADFGLATFFDPDQKYPLTSRVVTLWYRPPELLLGATEYGPAIDLWSTGCILAELLARKPIMPGRTEVEQLHKIFKLCGSPAEEYWRRSKLPHATIFKPQHPYKRCLTEIYKDFPQSALALLEILLAIDPLDRGTAATALNSEFFTTDPVACDPSSLPKYPPSKEYDVRIQVEAQSRQRTVSVRRQSQNAVKGKGSCEHSKKGAPAADANGQVAPSFQKCPTHSTGTLMHKSKNMIDNFTPQQDDAAPGSICYSQLVRTDAGGYTEQLSSSRSVSSTDVVDFWEDKQNTVPSTPHGLGSMKTTTDLDFIIQGGDDLKSTGGLSSLSTLVAARNNCKRNHHKGVKTVSQQVGICIADISQNTRREDPSLSCKHGQTKVQKLDERYDREESVCHDRPRTMRSICKAKHIHFSGPLITASSNFGEILESHERNIQKIIRLAQH